MKRRMVQLLAAVISVLTLTLSGAALAGPATDVVKAKQTVLFDLLKGSGPDNQKKLDGVLDEMLDYGSLAEASLGTEWAARTDAEKAQFTDLLKQLVRTSYQRNLRKISSFNVNYLGEDPADGAVLVKTQSKPTDPRDEPVAINFKMMNKGASWKIQDIVTDDVSLVTSYRSQFTKVIKKDGFPGLIQKMKDKLAKGEN